MKEPLGYTILTYAWVALLSILGGIVSHINRVNNGMEFTLMRFCTDIVTSAFVGIVTFYLCQAADFSDVLTAALVAISGHMGSRFLFMLEKKLKDRLDKL